MTKMTENTPVPSLVCAHRFKNTLVRPYKQLYSERHTYSTTFSTSSMENGGQSRYLTRLSVVQYERIVDSMVRPVDFEISPPRHPRKS